jgi:hypothetical protein
MLLIERVDVFSDNAIKDEINHLRAVLLLQIQYHNLILHSRHPVHVDVLRFVNKTLLSLLNEGVYLDVAKILIGLYL